MRQRIRSHLTYANVMATIAVFLVLGGGSAVALSGSNTVFSDDIVDNQVQSADVRDYTLSGGGLAAADLRTGSVASRGVVNGSIAPIDTNGLVPSGKVLWAVVNANGTVSRSSKSLTVTAEGGGDYEVQFGVANLDPCASVAQISKSSAGAGAPGPGEAATNQGENFETDIDVRTFNSAGTGTDLPFTVYVLCP